MSDPTRTVARLRDADGAIVGAGFLVDGTHVMSCAHVVEDAAGVDRGGAEPPAAALRIDLPFLGAEGLAARVVAWAPLLPPSALVAEPVADIAVLALETPLPTPPTPPPIRLAPLETTLSVRTVGFPASVDNGTAAGGELTLRDAGGWWQVRDTQDRGYFIEPGFSGAPLFDEDGRRLLGMVVAAERDRSLRLAFVIPVETLWRVWPPLANPYRELFPFAEEDAPLFFGREREVAELADKLARHAFLTVIGPSGSGKSSLVMAGLLPRLRTSDAWLVASCRPGTRPLFRLAGALAELAVRAGVSERASIDAETLERRLLEDPALVVDVADRIRSARTDRPPLLLVIDQLEEHFTLASILGDEVPATDAPTRRTAFVRSLVAIGRQDGRDPAIRTVATLRADFVGEALQERGFAELLRDADLKLGAMAPEALARAIGKPAERVDVGFDAGLLAEIVAATGGRGGALPLLQFALARLWARQRERRLTREAYGAIGGVEGALATHAEEVLATLSAAERDAARRLLPRLVRLAGPGERFDDARAIITRETIGEDDWTLLRRLADARLVVTSRDPASGQDTAELAHETLIRSWARLARWLDEDRELGLWRQRLGVYLGPWRQGESGSLLRDDLLAEARGWRRSHAAALDARERAFIDASIAAARRRVAFERSVVVAMALLSLIAVFFGYRADRAAELADAQAELARRQAERADEQAERAGRAAERANRAARAARAAELAARARAQFERAVGRDGTAALLALESQHLVPNPETQGLLGEILALTPRAVSALPSVPPFSELRQSPDGRITLVIAHDGDEGGPPGAGAAIALDARRGTPLLRRDTAGAADAALSANGRHVALAGQGRRLALHDLATGRSVVDEPREGLTAVAFSPDGHLLHALDASGRLETRYATDGTLRARLDVHPQPRNSDGLGLAVSPDGALLLSFPDAVYLGPADGPFEALADVGVSWTNRGAFDPSGRWIALRTAGRRSVQIRDAATGALAHELAPIHDVWAMTFDTVGARLAIGDEHGIVTVFDTASGERLETIDVAREEVVALAFASDGDLFIVHADGSVRRRPAAGGEPVLVARWAQGATTARLAADTRSLLLGDDSGALVRLDLAGGAARVLHRPDGRWRGVREILLDAAGTRVVATLRGRNDHSWTELAALDAANGEPLWRRTLNGQVYDARFSPDGATLATARLDTGGHDLDLWRPTDGRPLAEPDLTVTGDGLAFTADGERLVVVGEHARVLDPSTGRILFGIGEPGGVLGMARADGGRTLVSWGNGIVRAEDAVGADLRWRREDTRFRYGTTVSADGERYAYPAPDGTAIIVAELRSGRELARLPVASRSVSMILSPDGERLALHERDPTEGDGVTLWDVALGAPLARVAVPSYVQLNFGVDDVLYLWGPGLGLVVLDTRDGEELRRLAPGAYLGEHAHDRSRAIGGPIVLRAADHAMLLHPRDPSRDRRLDLRVDRARWNADGTRLLLGLGTDGDDDVPRVALLDAASGTLLWTRRLDLGPDAADLGLGIRGLDFDADGTKALIRTDTGGRSRAFLHALDVDDGRPLAALSSANAVVETLPLADPDLVAVRELPGSVRVLRLGSGETVRRIVHGFESFTDTRVARRASRALSWAGASLRVWSLDDGREIDALRTMAPIGAAAIDPEGRRVVYTVQGGQRADDGERFEAFHVHEVGATAPPRRIALAASPGEAVFDASGRRLAATVGGDRVGVWDVGSGRVLAMIAATPGAGFDTRATRFLADGRLVAEEHGERDAFVGDSPPSALRVWEIDGDGASEIARLDAPWRATLYADGRLLAAGARGGRVWRLDEDPDETLALPVGFAHCCYASTDDGRWLVQHDYEALRAFRPGDSRAISLARDATSDSLSAAAFGADMRHAFLAERDAANGQRVPGAVRALSVEDGAPVAAPIRPGFTVSRILTLADGVLLLGSPGAWITDVHERAAIWQPGEALIDLDLDDPVGSVAVDREGGRVALGLGVEESEKGRWSVRGRPRVSLRDVRTGTTLGEIALERPATALAFVEGGRLLAVRTPERLRIVRLDDGATLAEHEMNAAHCCGTLDEVGEDWVTMSDDATLRLVSPVSDAELVLPHDGAVEQVVPSLDGRFVASVAADAVHVWRVPSPDADLTAPRRFLLARFDGTGDRARPSFVGDANALYLPRGDVLLRLRYRREEIEEEVCRRVGRGLTERETAVFFPKRGAVDPCRAATR